jgi:hypothetical protein
MGVSRCSIWLHEYPEPVCNGVLSVVAGVTIAAGRDRKAQLDRVVARELEVDATMKTSGR